MISTNVI